jgi:CRISPR-associated protein Csm3
VVHAPEGKPYAFLPLHGGQPAVEEAPAHDRGDPEGFTGWLEVGLEALTPVTVLTGRLAVDAAGEVYAEMARHLGRPVLPGSSVRGMVRSVAEACSPSCTRGVGGRPGCHPGDARRACPACRVFGYVQGRGQAYRSRVRVEDFVQESGGAPVLWRLPQLFGPRQAVFAPRGTPRGRKFYYHGREHPAGRVTVEVLPAGATFAGRVYFQDLRYVEAAMLFFALGLDGTFDWKLGYGKPAYLGSLRPNLRAVHWVRERYGVRVGRTADPSALAREYAATGCGWPGVPAQVDDLRRVLGREVRGPRWRPNPPGQDVY